MKLKSRILGSSMVVVLALGMSAAPTFGADASHPPQATVPYDNGTMELRGGCNGLLIGSLADSIKEGLTNNLKDITSSSKGVPSSSADALLAVPVVGICILSGRLGTTTGSVPDLGTATTIKYPIKSGTKLHSSATSCGSDKNGNGIPSEPAQFVTQQAPTGLAHPISTNNIRGAEILNGATPPASFNPKQYVVGAPITTAAVGGDWQPAQRALSGKISYTYSDLTKTDAYARVQGFDTAAADIVWLTGIVTKGEALGSTIGGNIWFNPVFKAKLATGYFTGSTATDFTDPIFGASRSYAPGYGGNTGYSTGVALGCLAPAVNMGAGLTTIAIGGGTVDPLLGSTSAGIKFLL